MKLIAILLSVRWPNRSNACHLTKYSNWLKGVRLSSERVAKLDVDVAKWLKNQQPASAAIPSNDAAVSNADASSTPAHADGDASMSDAPASDVAGAASSAPAPAADYGVASTSASDAVQMSVASASGALTVDPTNAPCPCTPLSLTEPVPMSLSAPQMGQGR